MASRYWVGGTSTWDATAGTKWALTSGGAGGQAVPTGSDDVFLDGASGAVTVTISANVTAKTLTCTGFTGTLAQNDYSQLTCSGSCTLVSTMTYSPTDSTSQTGIVFSTTATLTTGGLLIHTISSTASGFTITLGDNLSFMASKLCKFTGNATIGMNGKSINGNSATNRVLISSSTIGTARTITNATTSFTNADFRDITFSSASSLDLSAITGLSGDCRGNSITGGGSTLTFTTPATQTATGSSANWSTATWSERVPLPQDDVVLSLTAGQTLTVDMPRSGKSMSVTTAMNLTTSSINTEWYGSVNLTNLNTLTPGSKIWFMMGRSTYTLTSAGKSFSLFAMYMVGGTLNLQDAFTATSTFYCDYGTLNTNNYSFSCAVFTMEYISTGGTRAANFGSSAITVSSPYNSWSISTTGSTTLNMGTSTLTMNANSSTQIQWTGGDQTYYNVTFSHSGTGGALVQGSNTFNVFTITNPGKTVTFTSGTTQTVSSFVATGTAGNLVTLNASTGGSAATLTAANTVPKNNDYMSITDINVTNGTFFYGGHSTYVSGTGWKQGNSSDMFRSLY